eukprot:c19769_g1_i1 orf=675-1430(+)
MEDTHSGLHHRSRSKESSRDTIFMDSFLELVHYRFTQSNRSWPFAHLADSLGGIYTAKQNVLMQDGCASGSIEKGQDIFRNGIDSNNTGKKFSSTMFAMKAESREEERCGIKACVDDRKDSMQFAKWSSPNSDPTCLDCLDVARKGVDKQVVQEMIKGVYTLSDLSSGSHTLEETWSKSTTLDAVDVTGQNIGVQLGKALPPDSLSKSNILNAVDVTGQNLGAQLGKALPPDSLSKSNILNAVDVTGQNLG